MPAVTEIMILMHKNDEAARFICFDDKPVEVTKITAPELMPIGLRGDLEFVNANFSTWCMLRGVPVTRDKHDALDDALDAYGGLHRAALNSHGLSLTDTYWYKEEGSDLTWEDVSLHKNGFSSDFLNIFYDSLNKPGISPDYTTGGDLKKMWTVADGRPVLIKSGDLSSITDGTGVLAANEVIASRIASLMGIRTADYQQIVLPEKDGHLCISLCFVNDDEDLVLGSAIKMQLGTDDRRILYDHIADLGFEEDLQDMITLDILLRNTDRHSNNFGIIYNADTMEPDRPAPVFDTGSCLGWNGNTSGAMKFPGDNIEDNLRYIDRDLVLPDIDTLKKIVKEEYSFLKIPEYGSAGIPEKQTELALSVIEEGYDTLSRVLPASRKQDDIGDAV